MQGRICMRVFLFLICVHLFYLTSFTQGTIKITGNVKDGVTMEPIQLANILILNTNTGTVTDENGNFFLEANTLNDTLLISYIGFKTVTVALTNAAVQSYNILLISENQNLGEIVIRPKEDPGKYIMRKVIEHKKQNDQESIVSYKARGYNKIEIDLGNLSPDEDSLENKSGNPFNILKDYVDSTSDVTTFLPFFFTETVSDYYYRKTPKTKKEVILATRTSGVNNASVSQVLGNYYEHFNIYDDFWYLLSKNFIPPLTSAWNFYYRVNLVDTDYVDNDWCYKIEFEPKQKQENVFGGYMWIVDSSFAVKEIYMNLDSMANINFYKRAAFYQKFDDLNDSTWVLKEDKLVAEVLPSKNSVSFIARKTTIYTDYTLDPEIFNEVIKYKDDIVYNDSVINNDNAFWDTIRPVELNDNETGVYELTDSLQNIEIFNSVIELFNTLMYGYWDLGYVRIGPLANTLSQDDEEGLRLRLGGKTGDLISKRMSIGGYLAYGIKDNAFKYGTDFSYVISKKPWQQFTFNYENDLDVNSNDAVTFGEDNILSGIYRRRETPQKIVDQEKYKWYYEKEWLWGLSNSLTLTSTKMHPLFDINYASQDDSIVSDINNTELKIGLRFAYREKFLFDNYRRYSLGTIHPILKINYSVGIKGFLESDFNYHAIEFIFYDDFPVRSFGVFDYRFRVGKIYGTLPSLLLHSPIGNETYFFNDQSFNLMNEYEFMTDTYAEAFFIHNFYGFFLNKIPLVRKLKLREVASFKIIYGELSERNQTINNYADENDPFAVSNTAPSPKPYMEAGIGVENILKLLRVDAIWRLTYRNNPLAPDFGIRLGINVDI